MTGRSVHRLGTRLLSAAMAVIGVALIVEAVATWHHGVSTLAVLGVLFLAAGSGRLYAEHKRGSRT
ncbi:MAG TPA: hypothetical protein VGX51_01690 [Solirubrobacteraceae bacterium]|jgi:hypothetical protein|nr:hypothetical protein [Solirubrobacteraceae bacterium]